MINTLKLNLVEQPSSERIYQVIIDDVPMLDMFKDYEQQFSDTINGSYTDALSEYSLADLSTHGKTFMPLGCNCGVFECWFVTGQITIFDQFVTWGRWENPYRSDRERQAEGLFWNYKSFPDIVFDIEQYKQEIEKAFAYSK